MSELENSFPSVKGGLENITPPQAGTSFLGKPKTKWLVVAVIAVIVFVISAVWIWGWQQKRTLSRYLEYREFTHLQEAFKYPNQVLRLDLSDQEINLLPAEIGKLHNLKYLNLTNNNLSSFPDEFWVLKNLGTLIIDFNEFAELPSSIGKLTNLVILSVQDNKLIKLTPEIGRLTKLKNLDLDGNEIRELPSSVGNLSSLESFQLNSNKLADLPQEMEKLDKLESLDLSYNQLESFPQGILQLPNLTTLSLLDSKISVIPSEIGNLTNLETLGLADNEIWRLPVEIGKLTNLRVLSLESNRLSTIPSEIGNLKKLEYLYLEDNPLLQPEFEKIKGLLPQAKIKLPSTFTYTNKEMNFSFHYPLEFSLQEFPKITVSGSPTVIVRLEHTKIQDYPNIDLTVAKTDMSIEQWIESNNYCPNTFDSCTAMVSGPIPDSIQFQSINRHYGGIDTFVKKGDIVFNFALGMKKPNELPGEDESQLYNQILSTFKFLD